MHIYMIHQATRLVNALRAARHSGDSEDRRTATVHYMAAARAMLADDDEAPRFYRTCAAVAAEQGDEVLAGEISEIANDADGLFAFFRLR